VISLDGSRVTGTTGNRVEAGVRPAVGVSPTGRVPNVGATAGAVLDALRRTGPTAGGTSPRDLGTDGWTTGVAFTSAGGTTFASPVVVLDGVAGRRGAAVAGSSASGAPIPVPRLGRAGPWGFGAALRCTASGPTSGRTTGGPSHAPAVGGIAVNGSPSTGADRFAADGTGACCRTAVIVAVVTTSAGLAPATGSERTGSGDLATVNGGRTGLSWTAPTAPDDTEPPAAADDTGPPVMPMAPMDTGPPDDPTPACPTPDGTAAAPAGSPPPEPTPPGPTPPERSAPPAATLLCTTGGTPEFAADPPGRLDPEDSEASRGQANSSGPPPQYRDRPATSAPVTPPINPDGALALTECPSSPPNRGSCQDDSPLRNRSPSPTATPLR
jgi:hypothetical protein